MSQHPQTPIYDPPLEPRLDVVYQDDDVLVLNKPSGLLSVPGRLETHKDCLQSRAQCQFPTATTVHRLDMETSGLIIMALNKPAHVHLSRQFEQRLTQKQYVARVFGQPLGHAGSIHAPLICDWPNRPKQMVDFVHGKPALTHWRVLRREDQTTLVALTPVTGRSHQLRVHMRFLGWPIVGDSLYATGAALSHAPRLALHSERLSIRLPNSPHEVEFNCPAGFVNGA